MYKAGKLKVGCASWVLRWRPRMTSVSVKLQRPDRVIVCSHSRGTIAASVSQGSLAKLMVIAANFHPWIAGKCEKRCRMGRLCQSVFLRGTHQTSAGFGRRPQVGKLATVCEFCDEVNRCQEFPIQNSLSLRSPCRQRRRSPSRNRSARLNRGYHFQDQGCPCFLQTQIRRFRSKMRA